MIASGTIYGVVLNDLDERARLEPSFHEDPYKAPPAAPVVYIKPRLCATVAGAPIPLPAGEPEVVVAATLALLFAEDMIAVAPANVWAKIGATSLALDISLPATSYYRPAIAQRCRDGFLPLGKAGAPTLPVEIVTSIDGEEAHRWSLSRLVRPVETLVADLTAFMTFKAGDVLLVGVPGDAPRARAGQRIRVDATGLAPIETRIEEERP
jgi:5-oxopent-3-ene-1,2,5-tricarboxylate decarboxylase / 2-hydroxyhepta-2,4-diene-1,7-dioate isomerase